MNDSSSRTKQQRPLRLASGLLLLLLLPLMAATLWFLPLFLRSGSSSPPSSSAMRVDLRTPPTRHAAAAVPLLRDDQMSQERIVRQQMGPLFQRQQQQRQQRHRDLIRWGSAICSLTPDTFLFQRDGASGLYVLVNSTNDDADDAAAAEASNSSSSNNNSKNDEDEETLLVPDQITVRVCWCTDYFYGRPLEFCPAAFDTCAVPPGPTDPVACYSTRASDTFVRSFWPVAIFWMIALSYACACSESGRHARRYARRRCCPCRPRRTAQADLDDLLEREPERAAYLYRRHVHRQRRAQRRRRLERHHRRWHHRLLPERFRATGGSRAENDDAVVVEVQGELVAPGDAAAANDEDRPRLELRTKVFRSGDNNDDGDDNEPLENGAEATTTSTSTITVTTDSGNNTRDNGSNTAAAAASGGGWSLPQLQLPAFISGGPPAEEPATTTLQDMDDEMEHGERCAICLLRLEDGDIIGDLPCHHAMHKDCLKDWLKRKNRCPLCQQADIALFVEGRNGRNSISTENNNNNNNNSDETAATAEQGGEPQAEENESGVQDGPAAQQP